MGMPGMRLSYKFKREQTPSITNLSWHFCPCCFLALLIYRSLPTLAGPIGGGKKLAEYYGRAYGMDTAEFAKNRLLEDFPYNRVKYGGKWGSGGKGGRGGWGAVGAPFPAPRLQANVRLNCSSNLKLYQTVGKLILSNQPTDQPWSIPTYL
eukprot:1146208-Pelagomonas_calceolata.AAC.3